MGIVTCSLDKISFLCTHNILIHVAERNGIHDSSRLHPGVTIAHSNRPSGVIMPITNNTNTDLNLRVTVKVKGKGPYT